ALAAEVPGSGNAPNGGHSPGHGARLEEAGRLGVEARSQRPQGCPPPVGDALQRDVLGEAVPGGVALRDGVPGPVLDRHTGLISYGLEEYLDLGGLLRREGGLAPGEDEAPAGLPSGNAADLEDLSVPQSRDETTAGPGLECELTVPVRSDREQSVRLPPRCDFASECVEGASRVGGHAQGNKHARCHLLVFCRWALNAESCRAHRASVSASHALSSAIASGRSR